MTDTPHLSEGQQSRPSQPTVRMNGAILRRCPPLPVGNQGTAAKNAAVPVPINAPFVKEKGNSITCAEEYREHIEYAFRGFCKVVLLSAAIHAARAGSGKDKPEISLEYLLAKSVVLQAQADQYFRMLGQERRFFTLPLPLYRASAKRRV